MPRRRGKGEDGDGVTGDGDGDGDGEESANNPSYDTFEQDFDSADEDGVSATPSSPRQKVDRAKM
eukprot:COSAG01_NODE_17773_length_1125_cov_1.215400_1_plen_64_part_10